MKKTITLLLTLALCLSMLCSCACNHKEVIDPAVAASCTSDGLTEGKHCSVCNKVLVAQEVIPALGHTTSSGTCERCGKSFGSWQLNYYVDDFQQPTSEAYVSNKNYFTGTFSNSATTNSKLLVTFLADADNIAVFLYEYGRHQVKNSSSYNVDKYTISMKTADGTVYKLTGTVYCGGDRLIIDDRYNSTVLKALNSGENISFHIVDSEHTTTSYLFTVETNNFAEEYAKITG